MGLTKQIRDTTEAQATLRGIESRLGRKGVRCWDDFHTEKGCGKSINMSCMISQGKKKVD